MRKVLTTVLALILFGCAKNDGGSVQPASRKTDQESIDVFTAQLVAKTYLSECWASSEGGSTTGYLRSKIQFENGRVKFKTDGFKDSACKTRVAEIFEKSMSFAMGSVDPTNTNADMNFVNSEFENEVYKTVQAQITLSEKSLAIAFPSSTEIRLGQEVVLPGWRYSDLYAEKTFLAVSR